MKSANIDSRAYFIAFLAYFDPLLTFILGGVYYPGNVKPLEGGFLLEKNMITKAFIMFLGLSSSLYSGAGHNSTTAIVLSDNLGQNAQIVVIDTRSVWITAYSSTPEETDDTPFITASGSTVRDGIVATNLLPFGTKIQIPELFGDKVFVVEDRMHERKGNNVYIWMSTKSQALKFGIAYSKIQILKEVALGTNQGI